MLAPEVASRVRAVALAVLVVLVLVMANRFFARAAPMPGSCQTPRAEQCAGNTVRLFEVGGGNPCMAVCVRLGSFRAAMCIDTGFAGPCLLSLPCLATAPTFSAPVETWCTNAQRALADVSSVRQEAALDTFVQQQRCSTFTSGCTMRLASIGTTKESTSDVILAPPLELMKATALEEWTSPRACTIKADHVVGSSHGCSISSSSPSR